MSVSKTLPINPDMDYRLLGPSGLLVSALSFGGWVNAKEDAYELTKECVIEAWSHGINFFDLAEGYAAGECETVYGKILKELDLERTNYVLSTKLFFGYGLNHPNHKGLSRKHLIEGMNASLKRLQLDYVDIVFAHRPDDITPMLEIVEAFTQIVRSGKAYYWATSEWSAYHLESAYHIADKYSLIAPVADQTQYSLLHRERIEKEYLPLYRDYRISSTIWSPLAGGILTNKYKDGIPEGSRFAMDDPMMQNFAKSLETPEGKEKIQKTKKLAAYAESIDTDAATLALAWTLLNKNVATVILGASRKEQVTRNIKALKVYKKLTSKDVEKIEEIFQNKPSEPAIFGRWAPEYYLRPT